MKSIKIQDETYAGLLKFKASFEARNGKPLTFNEIVKILIESYVYRSDDIKKVVLNFISSWDGVEAPEVKSIEKKAIGDPEFNVWHIKGTYKQTIGEGKKGYFTVLTDDSGKILSFQRADSKIMGKEPSLP